MDQHDKEKLDDPLSKLEHHTEVMVRKKAQNERLVDLKDDSNAKYKNDYAMNKLLRKNLRQGPLTPQLSNFIILSVVLRQCCRLVQLDCCVLLQSPP